MKRTFLCYLAWRTNLCAGNFWSPTIIVTSEYVCLRHKDLTISKIFSPKLHLSVTSKFTATTPFSESILNVKWINLCLIFNFTIKISYLCSFWQWICKILMNSKTKSKFTLFLCTFWFIVCKSEFQFKCTTLEYKSETFKRL